MVLNMPQNCVYMREALHLQWMTSCKLTWVFKKMPVWKKTCLSKCTIHSMLAILSDNSSTNDGCGLSIVCVRALFHALLLACSFRSIDSCRQFVETIEIPKYCKVKIKSSFLKWLQLIIVGVRLWRPQSMHAIFFSSLEHQIISFENYEKRKKKKICLPCGNHMARRRRGKKMKIISPCAFAQWNNNRLFLFVSSKWPYFRMVLVISGSRNKILF